MRATVVALGDLGLSARMRYHAQALAGSGVDVDLVGFQGTTLPDAISDNPRITVHRLEPSTLRMRRQLPGSTYVFAGTLDAARLANRLRRTLNRLPRPELVLVQNPPAFPTLDVSWWSLRRRNVRFVIDWHNLGYTLLRERLGQWHPAVRLARWDERRDARRVDGNLCVSRGLAMFLETRFGVAGARVLYDRPASSFAPLQPAERERYRQALFARLGIHSPNVGFVVCPTSWSEDEDFDLVIEAVSRLEDRVRGWEAAAPRRRFPDLAILVTGDGARRARFERRFAGLPARRVQLRARWLEPADYPNVVACADVGLSLHRSSSGLDIPMKVADLFGAGVPVCALDYGACLAERVRHADNGLLFSSAVQLADVLFDLFGAFPADQALLERLRTGVRRSARTTWEEGWQKEARPLLLGH
jgi:beta-1,4-mannosyltransferase